MSRGLCNYGLFSWRIEKTQGGVKPEGDPLPPIPGFGTNDDGTSGTSATDDLPF